MIVISEVRCSDCFAEFKDGPRFHVLKEDKSPGYSAEDRALGRHLYHVLVCPDCVGWYDDPIEAAPEEPR